MNITHYKDRIRFAFPNLTESEHKLAEFLIENGTRVAFWPAAEYGRTIGVSESTVIRFARTLGYASYSQFQKDLQEEIDRRLRQPIPQRLERATHEADTSRVLHHSISEDGLNLQKTLESCSEEDFNRAVSRISEAQNVYIVGFRASAAPAQFLSYALNLILPNVKAIINNAETCFDYLVGVDSQATVIAFSFARNTNRTLQLVDLVRQQHAHVVAVTDSMLSPLAGRADTALIVSTDSPAYIQSLTAVFSLCIALIAAISARCKDSAMARLERAEQLLVQHDVLNDQKRPEHLGKNGSSMTSQLKRTYPREVNA